MNIQFFIFYFFSRNRWKKNKKLWMMQIYSYINHPFAILVDWVEFLKVYSLSESLYLKCYFN